ncbi:hypothetical protein MKW98_020364 [Papaver atlanticum]|uniref:Uncharacterized protein n=1 Tax=Papaver atlanticum TaxID=357466 RepID=A0AAD4RVU0_9MAGN|nr:hypothetical protein MKW98_020364 [Papaver atlanticum]
MKSTFCLSQLGLKPVEVAAVKDNCQGVEILFPVTSSISSYVDWSTNGIMKHANSEKFENKMICTAKEHFLEIKSRGTSAFLRKEYIGTRRPSLGNLVMQLCYQTGVSALSYFFFNGLKLDPENRELRNAFRKVLLNRDASKAVAGGSFASHFSTG